MPQFFFSLDSSQCLVEILEAGGLWNQTRFPAALFILKVSGDQVCSLPDTMCLPNF